MSTCRRVPRRGFSGRHVWPSATLQHARLSSGPPFWPRCARRLRTDHRATDSYHSRGLPDSHHSCQHRQQQQESKQSRECKWIPITNICGIRSSQMCVLLCVNALSNEFYVMRNSMIHVAQSWWDSIEIMAYTCSDGNLSYKEMEVSCKYPAHN